MPQHSYLATPTVTRDVLDRHGLAAKKSLGQNFLVNDAIVGKILDAAQVVPEDTVLEVGPGIGTLTAGLLGAGTSVIAIERDPDMPEVLKDTLAEWSDHFVLIQKDALHLSEPDIARASCELAALKNAEPVFPNKLVANLPYNVAATIVLDYFQRFPFIESATVMVQREVADRMQASPSTKIYGAYTVKLALYAEPSVNFHVAPANFLPAPHVESTVIRLDRASILDERGQEVTEDVKAAAANMADAAFHLRRKTVLNSMKTYLRNELTTDDIIELLEAAGIDKKRRGETLNQRDFINLGTQMAGHTLSGLAELH